MTNEPAPDTRIEVVMLIRKCGDSDVFASIATGAPYDVANAVGEELGRCVSTFQSGGEMYLIDEIFERDARTQWNELMNRVKELLVPGGQST